MDALSNTAIEGGRTARTARLPLVDALRGLAVSAMVVYHTSWDLSDLRLVEVDIVMSPGWRIFARTIASTFLVLVGVGLVLAHGKGVRVRPFLRRLVVVAGAALVVTVATIFVFPESYIFFGILHNVAVSSCLALLFVRTPAWLSLVAGLLILAAPLWPAPEIFNAPLLSFLGLGTRIPDTNDWVPIFPWSGLVLVGVAAMRAIGPQRLRRWASTSGTPLPVRPLAWLGRHSLIIYLAHQPLIFGALAGYVQLFGPNQAAVAAPFLRNCAVTCEASGGPAPVCHAACECTVAELKRADLWTRIATSKVTPAEVSRASGLARQCYADAMGGSPAPP